MNTGIRLYKRFRTRVRECLSAKNDTQSYAHYRLYIYRTFVNLSMLNAIYIKSGN